MFARARPKSRPSGTGRSTGTRSVRSGSDLSDRGSVRRGGGGGGSGAGSGSGSGVSGGGASDVKTLHHTLCAAVAAFQLANGKLETSFRDQERKALMQLVALSDAVAAVKQRTRGVLAATHQHKQRLALERAVAPQAARMEAMPSRLVQLRANASSLTTAVNGVLGWLPAPGVHIRPDLRAHMTRVCDAIQSAATTVRSNKESVLAHGSTIRDAAQLLTQLEDGAQTAVREAQVTRELFDELVRLHTREQVRLAQRVNLKRDTT